MVDSRPGVVMIIIIREASFKEFVPCNNFGEEAV